MNSTSGLPHNGNDARSRPSVEQPYSGSVSRDTMPPPPQYASIDQKESPSTSPTRRLFTEPSERYTISAGDRSSDTYVDEPASSPPPPPPPHRTSPVRSMHRNSVSRMSIGGTPGAMGHTDVYAGENRSDQVPHDVYLQDGESGVITNQQLPAPQPNNRSDPFQGTNSPTLRPSSRLPDQTSYSSNMPFAVGAATPGSITPASTPDVRSSRYSGRSIPLEDYSGSLHYPMASYYNDSPYRNSMHKFDPTVSDASINPYDIEDDGDDGFMPHPKRKSALPLNAFRSKGPAVSAAGAESAAVTDGVLAGKQADNQSKNGSYALVDGANGSEKAEWLANQQKKKRKRKMIIIAGVLLVIVLVIVAGVVGGIIGAHNSKGSSSGSINNAGDDTATNGDLDLNSAEIKALMNNSNLHKVFPGMDYTPWGVQYPLCLTYPPSQNNVTRDMAVLSQLTNTVRLYGTDCNQTEMVIHAIDKLQLTDMKVWLGVWVDTNQTTTDRQIANMYKILADVKDKTIFKGAIIGNEALYRAGEDKAQSKQELITLLTDTRSNFTSLGYSLPIATSDLGDNWSGDLVAVSDYVMSNIHPFFAGVTADVAAAWTWDFWQTKDVPLTTGTSVKQIISETGWPSGGGTDCGGTDGSCATGQSGSVASIDNMNIFMSDWVCQALANGTDYFWFEAFDEPWKVQYNTATQQWEDKWGLMDQARNLKSGIKIPDCGGTTVSS